MCGVHACSMKYSSGKMINNNFVKKRSMANTTTQCICVAGSSLRAEFQFCDVLGVNRYNDDRAPYDVVSCFFALHYFLASEEAIHNLLMNASGNLKKGNTRIILVLCR